MYMMCPDEVGRDSGDWGGQESEVWQDLKSHQELGEEALTERTFLGIEAERPKILVDFLKFNEISKISWFSEFQ